MWLTLEGVGREWGALGIVHVAMFWVVWTYFLNGRLATREQSLDEFGRIERGRVAAERRG